VHLVQRPANSAKWAGGARRRGPLVQAPVTLAPLDVGAIGQALAMPGSAPNAARAPGAPPRVQRRRTLASRARPAPGVRSGAPSPIPSARLAPLEDGQMRRGRLPCRGASAAILAPTARMWEPPARASVDGARQGPGAGWLVLHRMRLARHARRVPGAAPRGLPVKTRASAARRAHGVVLMAPAPRALAMLAVWGSTSQRWARLPRAIASSVSLAVTTTGKVLQGAPGALKVPGAVLEVQRRAMSARMASGLTSRVRFMRTTALAVIVGIIATLARPPALPWRSRVSTSLHWPSRSVKH